MNLQYFRGNGRAVVVGEKVFINAGTGLTYLCSPEVPAEVTKTINSKKFHPGPGWEPVSGLNPELATAPIGATIRAWPDNIRANGGCDILQRIA